MRLLCSPLRHSVVSRRSSRCAILNNPPTLFASTRAFASKGGPDAIADVERSRASDGPNEADLPSEIDLVETIRRLEKLRPPALKLPLLVIDSMLPGQRLSLGSAFDKKLERFSGLGDIGVFGMSHKSGQGAVYCQSHGVTATLQQSGAQAWEIIGRRPISLTGPDGHGPNGVDMVRAEFIEDEVCQADVEAARALPPLVEEWCEEVRRMKAERFEGQLTGVLADLGPMPTPELADTLAFWVAALVNPLPALGVAFEIRPAVLAARNVGERVGIAREGIEGSIGHVTGRRRLF